MSVRCDVDSPGAEVDILKHRFCYQYTCGQILSNWFHSVLPSMRIKHWIGIIGEMDRLGVADVDKLPSSNKFAAIFVAFSLIVALLTAD